MADNYYPILSAVKQIIDSLNLKDWNNNPLPSAIRKLPKADETIDTLPLLCIVPENRPPQKTPISFGYYKVTYPVEVAWIVGGDRDYTSNLSSYTAWQTAISAAFNLPAALKAIVPAVWDANAKPGLVIDRAQVNDNYDYGGLTIDAITSEAD